MPTAFTEFLRQEAAKRKGELERNEAAIDEWRAAIGKLYAKIRAWLADSDPDHIIAIKESQHEVDEPGLGPYTVPRLDLRGLGRWVGIIPKARRTVGTARPPQKSAPERAAGRVDLTNELLRYVLYRFPQAGGEDLWMIDDLRSEPRPLDQQAFEEALQSYLR
jgi:hypothetical protein